MEQQQGQNASAEPRGKVQPRGRRAQTQQAPKANSQNSSAERSSRASGVPPTGGPENGPRMQQKQQSASKQAPSVQEAGQQSAAVQSTSRARKNPERKRAADTKKPDVAVIKSRTANFHAQPRPDAVKSVTFVQNRTIVGSQNWHGPQYVAFRNYRPLAHDRAWYHGHYDRIVLIGGGYYFFNAGYWYPAWGYAPAQQYYAYDGPIYAGREAAPPDQVIANVQSSLQEMGYYTGEVDGLLGPLTQDALNGYQADNDLTVTGAIDEPTLASLNLA